MKRKYAAMALGMVLAITPVSVYAEESTESVGTETAALSDTEDTEENTLEAEDRFWGQVVRVEEGTVTVSVGTLEDAPEMEEEETAAAENTTLEAAEDSTSAEEGTEAVSPDEEGNAELPKNVPAAVLTQTGEEVTVNLTEDTQVYLVYGKTDAETLESSLENYDAAEREAVTEENAEEAGSEEETASEESGTEAYVLEDNASEENVSVEDAENLLNPEEELMLDLTTADSILENDLVGIVLDTDGNAASIWIVLPESEVTESTTEAEDGTDAAAVLEENTEEAGSTDETAEEVLEEIVIE